MLFFYLQVCYDLHVCVHYKMYIYVDLDHPYDYFTRHFCDKMYYFKNQLYTL
jgi:hypothetical protein